MRALGRPHFSTESHLASVCGRASLHLALAPRFGYQRPMSDSLFDITGRVGRFVFQTGIAREVRLAATPQLVGVLLRNGLNVRTIHHVHAALHPDRIAMMDERSTLTYRAVNRWLNRIARALATIGVKRGDRIILCMENRTEYLLFWFASFRAGIAVVHASYRSTPDELEYLAAHSRARAIICSETTADAVRALVRVMPEVAPVVVDDVCVAPNQHRFPEWAAVMDDSFVEPGQDARTDNVVYTSGTTGKPKGAIRNFTDVGIVELSRIGERLPLQTAERHLVVSPLYHSGAQAFVTILTSLGGSIHLRPHFDAADALHYLHRWRIESTFMVPTMIRRILDLPQDQLQAWRPPSLRALVSGAAAFPHALRLRAVEYFGEDAVWDFYGATELGWITLIGGDEMLERPGSVGRVLSGHELRILDGDRREVAPGEVGTIWVRNEQMMEGYLDDATATAASSHEGWTTVDDLGRVDDDGYLYLAGRDRDMVISGGVNIYPVEIEEALATHPAVQEVAVIGLEDEEWGERVAAVVVGEANIDELDAWVRERVASHKAPRSWFFVDALPRNPTGKVLKRELRERFS